MNLEHLALSELNPFDKNPRVNEHAVDAVARSIQEFGFNCPIVVGPDMRICAGHTRWKAATKLGMETVPVLRVDSLTAERFIAFNIADNQTASLAMWEDKVLTELLEELRADDQVLSALGFSREQLETLLKPEQEFDWEALDQRLEANNAKTHVLLPVKIPVKSRSSFKDRIKELLRQDGINESDFAIAVGILFGRLLGVQ